MLVQIRKAKIASLEKVNGLASVGYRGKKEKESLGGKKRKEEQDENKRVSEKQAG